ncbi:DUF3553 domain-containing protein [Roseicyclus sp.]|uniref:DUF3553 domain-containing protein n=1 Tax=Roseicyclus sp. TaxID=1914329 RepID=UPI003F6B6A73
MQDDLSTILEPGMFVLAPDTPDWGLGQVQSNVGGKITVNFENEGKLVLDARHIRLQIVYLD